MGATNTKFELGPRRGWVERVEPRRDAGADEELVQALTELDMLYRTLVSILFNCVPTSGHPGGSLSSGRIVHGLMYAGLDLDLADPDRPDADQLVYAAGHKALGLYVAWALRDELARAWAPELLPGDHRLRLRLEDLLGFRRNPVEDTPLMRRFESKALDGHPTPATPFVRLATGASGVGVPSAFGLAWAAMDLYPQDPPRVHILEGEGGLTPGRVAEAMAAAATAGLRNAVLHVDFNQASIDSDRVCREGNEPGDYVQWDPVELARFHDFNVVRVDDGHDLASILAAQKLVAERAGDNHQPSCVVYRTRKGYGYGIEGRGSHGAGHGCCSDAFYASLADFEQRTGRKLERMCAEPAPEALEAHEWELLEHVRGWIADQRSIFEPLARRLADSREQLEVRARHQRPDAPDRDRLFDTQAVSPERPPEGLACAPGEVATLRGALGRSLGALNRLSSGALAIASADLAHSTSIALAAEGFSGGFFHANDNPAARLLSMGGICEDAMGAWLCAVSAQGEHLGVGSSYGAFVAAMQHVPARLHAIGQQARREAFGDPAAPYILICAHAGLLTGEDGPTHADPQCLQLLQDNFPAGAAICLTPWDPAEVWPLLVAGLQARPAVLAPFVTRPAAEVLDRRALCLPPPSAATQGLYAFRQADPGRRPNHGAVVIQGAGVARVFLTEVLPRIERAELNLDVLYVSSAELFDRLPPEQQTAIFPPERAERAMGITGFTLPTLQRWVTSPAGRRASLHAFGRGGYPGSGRAERVMAQAGLDGPGQWAAVKAWAERCERER